LRPMPQHVDLKSSSEDLESFQPSRSTRTYRNSWKKQCSPPHDYKGEKIEFRTASNSAAQSRLPNMSNQTV
jgi:hypothetical protein